MERRSSRIVALEKKKLEERERKLQQELEMENKKLQERERKLEKALKRKNNAIRNKGKGKATMEVCDNNEEEQGPTKKRCKSKELDQLISSIKSIQELSKHSQESSAPRTNVSSLNGMLLKQILEIIIDFLQRKDPHELFAEPVNPNMVKHYYDIVKQPMDFGTMRAKLHEGFYTNLNQFKCDVILICCNAKFGYPKSSKYHEVAEDISRHAKLIFEAISADPEQLQSELVLNKKPSGVEPQNGQQRTSRRVSSKPAGRTNSSSVMVPETEKRDMYWPPSKPLVSDVLHASKPITQMDKNPMAYKESLLRFVKDLGPIAQGTAAKKLEAHGDRQLSNGDTPTQNHLENVSGTEIIHQPTPQTPKQDAAFNAKTLTLPSLNRPLTIPGSSTQENRINMSDGPNHENKTHANESWYAHAASLLSNIFFKNDKGGSSSGIERSKARGSTNFLGLLKDKMVSPLENVSSLPGPVHGHAKQLQLGVDKTSNTRPWDTSAGVPNMLGTGSPNNVYARVYPTGVISRPQPKQFNPILSGNRNIHSGLSVTKPHPRSENTLPNINLTRSSPMHQPHPEDFIYFSDLSHVSQSRAKNFISCTPSNNFTMQSPALLSQPRPIGSMYGMPSNNLTEPSNVHQHQKWPADSTSSLNPLRHYPLSQPKHGESIPGTSYQPANFKVGLNSSTLQPEDCPNHSDLSQLRPIGSMYSMPSNNLTALPNVHQHQQQQANSLSSLNPLGHYPLSQPRQGESIPGTSYQPWDLQAGLNSSSFTNAVIQAQHTPPTTYIGGSEGAPSQLDRDNDQQPNLALQL